jgi:hypothetical protein
MSYDPKPIHGILAFNIVRAAQAMGDVAGKVDGFDITAVAAARRRLQGVLNAFDAVAAQIASEYDVDATEKRLLHLERETEDLKAGLEDLKALLEAATETEPPKPRTGACSICNKPFQMCHCSAEQQTEAWREWARDAGIGRDECSTCGGETRVVVDADEDGCLVKEPCPTCSVRR